jgi:hypothetical protein
LDRFLAGGGEKKEAGWKRYLQWNDLKRSLAKEEIDIREIGRLRRRWEAKISGLDHPQFRRVARALEKVFEIEQLRRQPGAIERFEARMKQLAKAIDDYRLDPSNDHAATIRAGSRWLDAIGQQSDIVARVRSNFAQPNLLVQIDGNVLLRELQRQVVQRSPVRRCFEGSFVQGTALTDSDVSGLLVPCPFGVRVQLQVDALITANNVAQKRRVYVQARSYTTTLGTKLLTLTEEGLQADPACANASTIQYFLGACVDRRIGRRLLARGARRRAEESRMRAQCVASTEATRTLVSRMEDQARDLVTKANTRLTELKARLRQQELYPESVQLCSTSSHIFLNAVSRDDESFSASEPPPLMPAEGELLVRAHQSLVNNQLTRYLGGIKIDSDTVVEMMEKYGVQVPEELRTSKSKVGQSGNTSSRATGQTANEEEEEEEEERDEKWSMTFDEDLPASISFEPDSVRVSLRGRNFTRGAREVNEKIEITAAYRLLRTTDGHLHIERLGNLEVRFVNATRRLTTTQLSYKVFLERKFSALFKDQITSYELERNPNTARIKDLVLNHIQTAKGWLAVGVSLRPGVRLLKQS